MSLPRMRTAEGVHDIIKDGDPETKISLSFIRKIIKNEEVRVVHVGNRKLVDADEVIAYLSGNLPCQNRPTEPIVESGKIRSIMRA